MDENNEVRVLDTKFPALHHETYRNDYKLKVLDNEITLKRDVDFGKISEKYARPNLLKPGAEKILLLFGVRYNTEVTFRQCDFGNEPFIYYECKTTAYDSQGNVCRVGYGCANSKERSCGFGGAFDTANSVLKKAEKRSVVDLALKVGACSDLFYQDLEDVQNDERAKQTLKDDDSITTKQRARMFAIASTAGVTQEETKKWLATLGITSTKDIKVKDYDSLIEKLQAYLESKK